MAFMKIWEGRGGGGRRSIYDMGSWDPAGRNNGGIDGYQV